MSSSNTEKVMGLLAAFWGGCQFTLMVPPGAGIAVRPTTMVGNVSTVIEFVPTRLVIVRLTSSPFTTNVLTMDWNTVNR